MKKIFFLILIAVFLLPISIGFSQTKKKPDIEIVTSGNETIGDYESIFYPHRAFDSMPMNKEKLLLKLHSEQTKTKLEELKKLSKNKYYEMLWALPVPIPKKTNKDEEALLNNVVIYSGPESPERAKTNILTIDIEINSLKYQAANPATKGNIKGELANQLNEYFNIRLAKMQQRVKEAQEKLNSMNQQLNSISKNKEQIVNKRLNELIGSELKPEYDKFISSAIQLIKSANYREAIETLNKAIAQNPSNSLGYKFRADCFAKTKEYSNSRYDYRRAISLEIKNSVAKTDYENALYQLTRGWYKEIDQKIESYKKEIAVDKEKSSAYLKIAKCYTEKEEWKKAEEWYTEYFNKEKNILADEVIRCSAVLAKTGSINKGVEFLKKYTVQFPEDWRLWSRYGYFAMWLGKNELAKTAFETTLKIKPFFKEAQDGLDMVNKQSIKQ